MSGTVSPSSLTVRMRPGVPDLLKARFGSMYSFAESAGVNPTTVYRWLRPGEASPSAISVVVGVLGGGIDDHFEVGFSDGYTFTPVSSLVVDVPPVIDSGVSA